MMASSTTTATKARLDGLPSEILLQVLSYLSPYSITQIQLVSPRLRRFCLDDTLWRERCFEDSAFLATLRLLRLRYDRLNPSPDGGAGDAGPAAPSPADGERSRARILQRHRDMENWNPAFPAEHVSWYDEYIHRHGRVSTSWLQQPRIRRGGGDGGGGGGHDCACACDCDCAPDDCGDVVDVTGAALYRDPSPSSSLFAVSPLDDGSVCLWDLDRSRPGRNHRGRGAIVARSRPGILFVDGPGGQNTRRSKRINTGVTECVSVNHQLGRAFFAVQNHLIDVDLNRLEVADHQSFPWSITALSAAERTVPLTVATNGGIHLYDYRERASLGSLKDPPERVDAGCGIRIDPLKIIFDPRPLPKYGPLSQPTALSILHLPRPGAADLPSDDIYVAGRFTSILHYDRRKFPAIMGSIHSGASLSSLACLPYPFSSADCELRRRGLLSPEQVDQSKAGSTPDRAQPGGRTLIACGEYNSRGSLEMYGLSTLPEEATVGGGGRLRSGVRQGSRQQNRQTSASSKILSVASHGTRIVCSDGSGNIKWFERDGVTEVRHHHIGHSEVSETPSLFASMPGSDDLARKVVPTGGVGGSSGVNADDLLFWTGEQLGLVTFTSRTFNASDFDNNSRAGEVGEGAAGPEQAEDEERIQASRYSEMMRQALSRQADEVRFLRDLGIRCGE